MGESKRLGEDILTFLDYCRKLCLLVCYTLLTVLSTGIVQVSTCTDLQCACIQVTLFSALILLSVGGCVPQRIPSCHPSLHAFVAESRFCQREVSSLSRGLVTSPAALQQQQAWQTKLPKQENQVKHNWIH